MVRSPPKRENIAYRLFPKVRSTKGRYSGEIRDYDAEEGKKEPDLDKPHEWLNPSKYSALDFIEKTNQLWIDWTQRLGGWKKSEGDLFWTGQSHLDVAWEWRIGQTVQKSIVTYRKACFHAQNLPEYIFAASQPLTFEFVRQNNPELFKEIQTMHKKGKFELVGGLWTEPDARMPSGEAFIRNRLYGQLYYLEHFGEISRVEWLPDTFGYSYSMPQIIKKSGGEYFFTTKVWGNHKNYPAAPWPFTNFWWQGPDGSRVLAHIQPQMFGPIPSWSFTKPLSKLVKKGEIYLANYTIDKPHLHEKLSDSSDDYVKELGVFFGLGDGGHGPTGEEIAQRRIFQENGGGHWSTVHAYFDILYSKYFDRLPIWDDELYFQAHQGTLTTQGLVKHMNRLLEWRITGLEMYSTLIEMVGGPEIPYAQLTQVWKDILTNQFHDILPGSSIAEVYDDTYDYFIECQETLNGIEARIVDWLISKDGLDQNQFICINTMGFQRYGLIELPISRNMGDKIKSIVLKSEIGEKNLPVQFIPGDNDVSEPLLKRPDRLGFVMEMDSFEWVTGKFSEKVYPEEIQKLEAIETEGEILIKNAYLEVTINKLTGSVISALWKPENGSPRQMFHGSAFELRVFADFIGADAWEISPSFRDEPIDWIIVSPSKIVEFGSVRAVVETQLKIDEGESLFIHRIILYADLAEIHTELLVDWKDPGFLIKEFYGLNLNSEFSLAEIPAAVISRKTAPTASHDVPRWEKYCQTFVDMPSADNSWGIAFMNDGKYGYATVDGGFELTLLRKPHYPKIAAEAWCLETRQQRIRNNEYIPTTTDEHWHVIRQAIVPHEKDWIDACISQRAHAYNCSVITRVATQDKVPFSPQSNKLPLDCKELIYLSSQQIEIMTIKCWEPLIAQGESGYVVRLLNMSSQKTYAKLEINPNLDVKEFIELDLLERFMDSGLKGNIADFSLNFVPFEIRTFLLR